MWALHIPCVPKSDCPRPVKDAGAGNYFRSFDFGFRLFSVFPHKGMLFCTLCGVAGMNLSTSSSCTLCICYSMCSCNYYCVFVFVFVWCSEHVMNFQIFQSLRQARVIFCIIWTSLVMKISVTISII